MLLTDAQTTMEVVHNQSNKLFLHSPYTSRSLTNLCYISTSTYKRTSVKHSTEVFTEKQCAEKQQ